MNYAREIGSDSLQGMSHHLDSPDVWAYRVLKKVQLRVKFRKAERSRQSQVMRAVTRFAVGWNWQASLGYGQRWNIILMALSTVLLSIFFPHHGSLVQFSMTDGYLICRNVEAPVPQDWKRQGHRSSWKQMQSQSVVTQGDCCLVSSFYPQARSVQTIIYALPPAVNPVILVKLKKGWKNRMSLSNKFWSRLLAF